MKYVSNPVIVDAFEIVGMSEETDPNGNIHLYIKVSENGEVGHAIATPEMLARMKPSLGDYYVRQASDGYECLFLKELLETMYSRMDVQDAEPISEQT